MQKAQEDGLIKHVGLSEVSVEQIQKAEQYIKVVSVQNMYSVENRKYETELQYCEENGIAFIPWYPLGGGNVKALEKLQSIADKYDATAHQLALSWLLHHSDNILLIPGTSKLKHLEENFAAGSIKLSADDMEELEKLRAADISG